MRKSPKDSVKMTIFLHRITWKIEQFFKNITFFTPPFLPPLLPPYLLCFPYLTVYLAYLPGRSDGLANQRFAQALMKDTELAMSAFKSEGALLSTARFFVCPIT